MKGRLINTALFKSLAPGQRANGQLSTVGRVTHENALFLSAASIVEIKAAIRKIPAMAGWELLPVEASPSHGAFL